MRVEECNSRTSDRRKVIWTKGSGRAEKGLRCGWIGQILVKLLNWHRYCEEGCYSKEGPVRAPAAVIAAEELW